MDYKRQHENILNISPSNQERTVSPTYKYTYMKTCIFKNIVFKNNIFQVYEERQNNPHHHNQMTPKSHSFSTSRKSHSRSPPPKVPRSGKESPNFKTYDSPRSPKSSLAAAAEIYKPKSPPVKKEDCYRQKHNRVNQENGRNSCYERYYSFAVEIFGNAEYFIISANVFLNYSFCDLLTLSQI